MSSCTHDHRPDLAVFIPSYAGGGGERVALFIAQSLADAGLSVDLVIARTAGELREVPVPGVRRVELEALNEMLVAPRWIGYLKSTRPRCAMSLIHSANFNSGLGALLVPSVPVIVNLRIALDCDASAQWWLRRRLGLTPERWLYKRAARVVGASRGVADEAARVLRVPGNQVSAIPNPVRPRARSASIPEEHRHYFDRPVVLGAGRLAPQKDFHLLLDAFARITEQYDANLVVLGEGPEGEGLRRRAAALGLTDRVFFPGYAQDTQPYMRRARAFVLSSRNEGFPNALLEAMAEGTAIVATDCPFGPREILDSGRHGSLVDVGDVAGLAGALHAELVAPDVGHEARRARRAMWMRQYEPDAIAQQYLRLVRDVILEREPAILTNEVGALHEQRRADGQNEGPVRAARHTT